MKKALYSLILIGLFFQINAQTTQVGINTTDPKATLDVAIPNNYNAGQLAGISFPTLSGDQIEGMATLGLKTGTVIYANAPSTSSTPDVSTVGFWYWTGDNIKKWEPFENPRELVIAKNAEDPTKIGYTLRATRDKITELGVTGIAGSEYIGDGAIDFVTRRGINNEIVTYDGTDIGAQGEGSFAWGYNNLARGKYSTVWGMNNEDYGVNNTVFGGSDYWGGMLKVINPENYDYIGGGGNVVKGSYSLISGSGNYSKGNNNVFLGDNNSDKDSDDNSSYFNYVFGSNNQFLNSYYNNILGQYNVLNSSSANVIGRGNRFKNFEGFVLGDSNTVEGTTNDMPFYSTYIIGSANRLKSISKTSPNNNYHTYNIILGFGNEIGENSQYLNLLGINSTVENNTTTSLRGSRLFSVGNGFAYDGDMHYSQFIGIPNSTTSSDAFTILKNGQVGIGYDNFETRFINTISANTPTQVDINGNLLLAGINSNTSTEATDKIVVADADGVLKTKDISALNTNAWSLTGNEGTDSSVNFIGTTDYTPLIFKVHGSTAGILTAWGTQYGNVIFGENAANIDNGGNPSGSVIIGTGAAGNLSNAGCSYDVVLGNAIRYKNGGNNVIIGSQAFLGTTEAEPPGSRNIIIGSQVGIPGGEHNILLGGGFNDVGNYRLNIGNTIYGFNVNRNNPDSTPYENKLIGISVPNPTENLDINKNIRVRGLPTNISTNISDKVVVSDDNGVLKTIERSTLGGGSLQNIYTSDGTIPANTSRTVTVSDGSSVVFQKVSGSTTVNEVVNVLGTVKTTAVDLNSDQRLKQNIQTLENSTSNISALRPVSYHWNEQGKAKGGNNNLQYGFIAQEVEKVLPHLVNTDKDGYKSVNYIEVIPVLVKALQEEKKRNDDQEARIKALEEKK